MEITLFSVAPEPNVLPLVWFRRERTFLLPDEQARVKLRRDNEIWNDTDIMTKSDSRRGRKPAVPPAVEQQIDENLRLLFQQQLEEDLPENLKALVARLREEGPKR